MPLAVSREAGLAETAVEGRRNRGVVELGDLAAATADQEEGAMRRLGCLAADEGVEALDTMHQPLGHQEVERAVDRGWGDGAPLAAEQLQQLIGADRCVAAPDELEHPPTQLGELGARSPQTVSAADKAASNTSPVVVRQRREGIGERHHVSIRPRWNIASGRPEAMRSICVVPSMRLAGNRTSRVAMGRIDRRSAFNFQFRRLSMGHEGRCLGAVRGSCAPPG